MLGRTHFLAGAVVGSFFSWPSLLAAAAGALVPDIDSADSTLGKMIKPISFLIEKTVGHRTFFHSIGAAALAYVLGVNLFQPDCVLAFALGYASHIILDIFNPAGVELFWPFPCKIALPLVETGSLLDNILGVLFLAVLIFQLKGVF